MCCDCSHDSYDEEMGYCEDSPESIPDLVSGEESTPEDDATTDEARDALYKLRVIQERVADNCGYTKAGNLKPGSLTAALQGTKDFAKWRALFPRLKQSKAGVNRERYGVRPFNSRDARPGGRPTPIARARHPGHPLRNPTCARPQKNPHLPVGRAAGCTQCHKRHAQMHISNLRAHHAARARSPHAALRDY